MNILNFQSENPSDVDAFKGESHDRVAQAMHDYIENRRNHRVIGLDGEFGSGKSSILQMLEKKITLHGSKSKLWIFDCEQNYQGSIKSNFIELFTNQITDLLIAQNKEKEIADVLKNRDIALGRHVSYTKDTRSHISIWAVLLIASAVLSPTFIRDYLLQLRGVFALPTWQHALYLLATFAPVIILGFAFFFNRKDQPGKRRWNISSLLKGSSDDHISETIEISKEVSPLDLKRALAKHLQAVSNYHFIIVIDNLDRLPREVLRSVWSDLEIFTSVTGTENLSVIVPFCSTKVSKYLSGDDEQSYDSKDFIAKKFPVVFRTPPIITSGWKDAFRTLWSESFGPNNMADADACSIILQRHSPMARGLVTPRLQKRYINDIATTMLVTADKPSAVCIAAYIAICKYNSVAIEDMLKDPVAYDVGDAELEVSSELNSNETPSLDSNIHKTKLVLKTLVGDDMKTGWPIQILQIHFQTSSDIAIAELIDQPLANAIESQDGKKLASLMPYFGFIDSFVRGLEGVISPDNVFQTLYQASKLEGVNIEALLPYVSAKFTSDNQLVNYWPEPGCYNAIKDLISLGLDRSIFESPLNSVRKQFEEINKGSFDPKSVDSYHSTISHYDDYLYAMDEPFNALTLNSSEVLFHMVLRNPELKKIDHDKIALSSEGLGDALMQIASTASLPFDMTPLDEDDWQYCLTEYFGKTSLLGTSRPYFLDDEQATLVTAAIELSPETERLWLAAAFCAEYTSSISLVIKKHLPVTQSVFVKIAMAVIYIRQNLGTPLSEIPQIEEAFVKEPEYLNALLRAVTTSHNLFELTLQDESTHLIAPILAKMIKNRAVGKLYSGRVYTNFSELCTILSEWDVSEDEFLTWFTSFNLIPKNLPELEALDPLMLQNMLDGSTAKLLELRTELMDTHFGSQIDTETWLRTIESDDTNTQTALVYMGNAQIDFKGEKFAHAAISVYLLTVIKSASFAPPSERATSNMKRILKLFDNDTRSILGTELRSYVYNQSINVEASIFILSEFGALLSSVIPRTAGEEDRLLQILGSMHSDPEATSVASSFLDSRSSQLSDWTISPEHKDTYASYITKLKARMPRIYEDLSSRRGFKTLMKNLKKALIR